MARLAMSASMRRAEVVPSAPVALANFDDERMRRLNPTLVRETLARPEGSGRVLTTYEISIEGRDEWLAAASARSA